jgi:hypothetical protein
VQDESACLVDEYHGCPALTRIAGKRLDARVFLRRMRHHGTTRHGIAAISCVDRHMQQVAEDIDYAMVFMPFDLLAAVDPAFCARLLGLNALRVDNPITRRCRATVVLAMECIQLIQRGFPCTAFTPSAEVIVNRLPGGKSLGSMRHWQPDFTDVQDGIDDPFARMQAGTAPSITGLKIVFDQCPFGVRQVTRVSHSLSSKKKYLTLMDIFFQTGS